MIVKTFPSFADLPEPYAELFENSDLRGFYHSLAWHRVQFQTTADPDKTAFLLGVEDNNEPVALIPMRSSESRIGLFGIREVGSYTNFYTVHFQPIIHRDRVSDPALYDMIAKYLAGAGAKYHVVRFDSMNPHSESSKNLIRALSGGGFAVHPFFNSGNWYESMDDIDYAGYLGRRTSKIRYQLRNRIKRAEADLGPMSFELVSERGKIAEAVGAFEQVYQQSWKGSEKYPDFIREIAAEAAREGALRLGILKCGETAVAAKLTFVGDGLASMFKTAYQNDLKKYGFGTIINCRMAEHLIDHDKVGEMEFGIGDEPYKSSWMTDRRERWGFIAYNRKTLAGFSLAIMQNLRNLAKKVIGPNGPGKGSKKK